MVSSIVIPRKIMDELEYDGRRASKRKMEANGYLLGLYNAEDDSISVSEKHDMPFKVGNKSLKGKLQDFSIKVFLHSERNQFRAVLREYLGRMRESNEIAGLVNYHSHYRGLWSSADMGCADMLRELEERYPLKAALLLYVASANKFVAMNTARKFIPILSTS